jgi:hypothetical protein
MGGFQEAWLAFEVFLSLKDRVLTLLIHAQKKGFVLQICKAIIQ